MVQPRSHSFSLFEKREKPSERGWVQLIELDSIENPWNCHHIKWSEFRHTKSGLSLRTVTRN